MSEEKRLNDEKTLEAVTGGTGTDERTKDEFGFICNNCWAGCYYENHGGCPYGSKKNAFRQVGAGNKCPKKK